jgi:hypothetical protein
MRKLPESRGNIAPSYCQCSPLVKTFCDKVRKEKGVAWSKLNLNERRPMMKKLTSSPDFLIRSPETAEEIEYYFD